MLNITDESYCSLDWLKAQEGFFLTRPRETSCFFEPQSGQELDLEQIGPKVSHGRWQGEVLVGKHAQVPARLMVVRVQEEVIAQRQERIRKAGQTQGKSGQSKSVESSEMDHFDY